MRDGTVRLIPEAERYYHQIRGGVLAMRAILRIAAADRRRSGALTSGAPGRGRSPPARPAAIQSCSNTRLGSRGTEPVWMPDTTIPAEFRRRDVPVDLSWTPTRTTTRPHGYLLPPSMGAVVPKLQDHVIAVYRVRAPATVAAEVYYATSVNRDSYFQGHYLKSVDVVKQAEPLNVVPAGTGFRRRSRAPTSSATCSNPRPTTT